jgi:HK97 gp10 family phage protein
MKGLAEVMTFLSRFPRALQTSAFRTGLTAAAKPIRDEARLRARRQSGKMAKAIKTGSPRRNEDGTFSVQISLKGPHAFLGQMHEYGVAAHFITAGDSGMSARMLTRAGRRGDLVGDVEHRALKIGENYISGGVMHPGHSAHPFMRPSLDAKADEAVKAFADQVRAVIAGKTGLNLPHGGDA